jgi:hypothetical protein
MHCEYCGKEFEPLTGRFFRYSCSYECANEMVAIYARIRSRKKGINVYPLSFPISYQYLLKSDLSFYRLSPSRNKVKKDLKNKDEDLNTISKTPFDLEARKRCIQKKIQGKSL